ncbi:MAG: aminopeptidase P family protein [Candidatus Aenigmarchaeota archaeon]|nr:aminopeptidase P family protein [Candidatus Aenigmarchaeota archaeon]
MNELKIRLDKMNGLSDRIDAFVLFNKDMQSSPNFIYFTDSEDIAGFLFHDFSKPRIFTNARDYPVAKKSWIKDAEVAGKDTLEKLVKGKKIGIDESTMHVDIYKKLIAAKAKLIDIGKHLENARAQKTAYEIICIKEACKISGRIFSKVENGWHGMSEMEFKGLVEYEMHKHGVQPSFPTIVAAGRNIAVPHHKPTKQKIKLPLLVDFGVRYKNYVSDVTRTKGSRWENKIEKILKELYPRVKVNIEAKELDSFVRKSLGVHKKLFITSLGHGIGIAVHERPWISKNSSDVLKEGMTFTIEPGVYKANGIRIENDFLMTEDGLKNLTEF